MEVLLSAWTVLVAFIFTGVAVWAWAGRRRIEFEHAARIPLDDDCDEA
jgi:cbb3-type cytochrome oxidase subunit 3